MPEVNSTNITSLSFESQALITQVKIYFITIFLAYFPCIINKYYAATDFLKIDLNGNLLMYLNG